MIRVRNDDVIIVGSDCSVPVERFKCVHEIICKVPNRLIHVPTLVTEDLRRWPELVRYIESETKAGRMKPELHGLYHVDYGAMDKEEVKDHIKKAGQWMFKELDVIPTKWYTPWGASQPHLHEAAKEMNLELVDCSRTRKLKGKHGIKQLLSEGKKSSFFEGEEIIMHWWNGLDVQRIEEFVEVLLNEERTPN